MKKWIAVIGIIIAALAIGAIIVFNLQGTNNNQQKIEVSSETFKLPYDEDAAEKAVCAKMYVEYNLEIDSKYGTALDNTYCEDPPSQPSCYLFDKTTKVVIAVKNSTQNKITLYGESNSEEIILATNNFCASI